MSLEETLAALQAKVQYLEDRQAILDLVMRQARGHDRHDVEMMVEVFHEDGVDEHGPNLVPGPQYGEWANRTHEAVFIDHLHNITTHTCEIDGDVAHAESYVMGALRVKDHTTLTILGGRYVDRLERRNGEWRIALRRCTIEWSLMGDTSMIEKGAVAGFIKGTWGKDDVSYARPLTLDQAFEKW